MHWIFPEKPSPVFDQKDDGDDIDDKHNQVG
jgi:hypothetical protein